MYIVKFIRIGRHSNEFGLIPDLAVADNIDGADAELLVLSQIERFIAAGKYIRSAGWDLTVDLTKHRGWINDGRFGSFTLTRAFIPNSRALIG